MWKKGIALLLAAMLLSMTVVLAEEADEENTMVDGMLGIANPWAEMTAEELTQIAKVSFGLPEGAENIVYRWLESEGLAEMQFTLDADEFCARVKPAVLEEGQLENISGMYFIWEYEEEITVGGRWPGTLGQVKTGSEDYVALCLWYDAASGLMYSLSVYTTELDGLDLTAVADKVYLPTRGNT